MAGKYCGSGTTTTTATPIDSLDNCCRAHDKCFVGNHCSCEMVDCNQALVDCAKRVKSSCGAKAKTKMCDMVGNVIAYGNSELWCAGECYSDYSSEDYSSDYN